MTSNTIKVEGMSCDHCVQTIKKAVNEIPGIEKVEVDLEKKEVRVDFDEGKTDLHNISAMITGVGYEVVKN
ncbi:MAG: heavy-metal-associated domain-containing protein [Nitrospinaceae bacterium]